MDSVEALRGRVAELELENTRLLEENAHLKRLVLKASHNCDSAELDGKDALWPIRQQLLTKQDSPVKQEQVVEEKKPLSQREKIIAEIVETEIRFVSDLTLLQNLFQNPLRATLPNVEDDDEEEVAGMEAQGAVMTRNQFESIFSNSETLLYLNGQFLLEMRQRRAAWDEATSTVGDLFLSYSSMFKLYCEFCAALPRALATLKRLREQNPRFVQILSVIEKLPDLRRLRLESFLSLPMQRIPRYVLFLETLLKHTDSSHPDHPLLAEALVRMRSIADDVNESVAVRERAHHAMQVQERLQSCPFELVIPSRRFVREGPITKITSKWLVEDQYFLFSDILVYASRSSLQYKGVIHLGTAWVRDLPDSPYVKHLMQLVAPAKTFTFFFASLVEKQGWLEAITACIDALVQHDPSLKQQRGSIRHREPSSSFYAVLRDLFSYRPEDIEPVVDVEEDVDEFVLVEEDSHTTIRVDEEPPVTPKNKSDNNNNINEEKGKEEAFNDFLYWKL